MTDTVVAVAGLEVGIRPPLAAEALAVMDAPVPGGGSDTVPVRAAAAEVGTVVAAKDSKIGCTEAADGGVEVAVAAAVAAVGDGAGGGGDDMHCCSSCSLLLLLYPS